MDPSAPNEPSRQASIPEIVLARTGTAAGAVSARPYANRLALILVGGAGLLTGTLFVLALGWMRGDAPPLQTAAAAPAAAPAATKPTAPTVVESSPPPTWVGPRKATWARDGSKTIAFELEAVRDVAAWMSRVRPVLVVQCVSRATHAFVVLGTSAKFEEDDALHRSVQLQWDEGPTTVQRWETSQSGQELFAPDGIAFVRQLATGKHLRFGFTPFNAQPVTAEFAVQGFDQLAGLVATTCGWRL